MTIKSTTTKKNHLRKKCGRNQKKKKKEKELSEKGMKKVIQNLYDKQDRREWIEGDERLGKVKLQKLKRYKREKIRMHN